MQGAAWKPKVHLPQGLTPALLQEYLTHVDTRQSAVGLIPCNAATMHRLHSSSAAWYSHIGGAWC